jgi:hypothetical protein
MTLRKFLKFQLAGLLRFVAEEIDPEMPLSPEAEKALRDGIESAKRMAAPPPPVYIQVPYPVPEPAKLVPPWQPWPGYPQPYIGDPWPSQPWTITYGDPVTASGTTDAPFIVNN